MTGSSHLGYEALRFSLLYLGIACRFGEHHIESLLGAFSQSYTTMMIPRIGSTVLRQAKTQLSASNRPAAVASLSAFARLLSSLAVLEQRDGKLNHGSLGAVTAAQKLGGSITAFIAGANIKAVAEEAAKVNGIEKVIAVDNAAYDKVRHLLTPFFFKY